MLSTHKLHFSYPKGPAFDFPDFTLADQEHLLILGKSGVGKTTLLHLLGLLLRPKSGNITINGKELSVFGERQKDLYRGQHIGMVFQKPHFIKSLNVIENIESKLYFSKAGVETKKMETILDALEMMPFKYKKVAELSEGQKQRLSIAIALINRPGLILADEPTSALDDSNCAQVLSLLHNTAEVVGAHLLVITHDQRVKPYFTNTLEL